LKDEKTMSNEIIINTTPEETRVALIGNKILTELYFDRKRDRRILGNVYKGVVEKVLPGMQAAFVNIGTEKAAFLYVADIMIPREPSSAGGKEEPETVEFEEGSEPWADKEGLPGAEEGQQGDPGEGQDEQGAASAPRSEGPSGISAPGTSPEPVITRPRRKLHPGIEELLREGQEVVVQVSKEPIGTKGPRVTTYVSLPGRYLVHLPMVNHLGISRRIGQDSERQRLKEMICRLRKKGDGYIVRTVSDGMTEKEVQNDIGFLELVWQNIVKKRDKMKAPALIHADLDLVFRTVRDMFTKEIDRLVIDSKSEYDGIQDFVGTYFPGFASRIELWDKEEPLFEAFGLEAEISRARNRRVWLKSGGYLVIDRAEALTVIDVNTGRFVGKRGLGLEETILKNNLEAAKEIAWQLRLRNIGGIIIIDFIDMEKEKNREKVFRSLTDALKSDKAKTRLLKISDLGLVEMSRERTHEALTQVISDPCPYCEGRGYTKSPTTICYEIFREIRKMSPSAQDKKIVVAAHPSVIGLLYEQERQGVEALEKGLRKKVALKVDANLHIERYDLYWL
jgi:ribonuclease G